MAAAVAVLGSLGAIGLVMAPLKADAGRNYRAALRWGIAGAIGLGFAITIFALADVSGTVWFIPAGVLVVAVGLIALAG